MYLLLVLLIEVTKNNPSGSFTKIEMVKDKEIANKEFRGIIKVKNINKWYTIKKKEKKKETKKKKKKTISRPYIDRKI